MTSVVYHCINGRRATKYPATGKSDPPVVQELLRFRDVVPVVPLVRQVDRDGGRHLDQERVPSVAVAGSSLHQQHFVVRVGAQSIGEHAPSGSCANDDEVELGRCRDGSESTRRGGCYHVTAIGNSISEAQRVAEHLVQPGRSQEMEGLLDANEIVIGL
ncbi:unnamed protein product [Phytophthora lilii]|uniref:Unnamed protein product n=1 Tax=Phytophthora lilii TaxID=2077276 RepID=A0A9W6U8G9_9STRA|nr:unnamed protein product [Phytophthora lilii]